MHISKVNTKPVYQLILKKDDSVENDLAKKYWKTALKDDIKFKKFYHLNFLKLINEYTKDLHFLVINNALYTRVRLSKFTEITLYCAWCTGKNKQYPEHIFHALVECSRVGPFWPVVEDLLQQLEEKMTGLVNVVKVFGIERTIQYALTKVVNALIQLGQKAVWVTRNIFETTSRSENIWLRYVKMVHVQFTEKLNAIRSESQQRWIKRSLLKIDAKSPPTILDLFNY